ncbi:RHS repeat domain-containing protein [Streptomyces zaomyceticus]|uniref:RHS repeat domain-containing protein n=1 Tax=Streptomyces zaomyceticus TaxID=68286 RepID=UPI0034272D00
MVSDHHNTNALSISASSLAVNRRKTMPFGGQRGTAPYFWPGTKGFVGGDIDSTTNLTHIGAREYDATLGQFISADPLLEIDKPQTLNSYSYAGNNPTTFSDPTGLGVDDGTGHTERPDKRTGEGTGKPRLSGTSPTGAVPADTQKPSQGTNGATRPGAAVAPKVESPKLQAVLNLIYIKPGAIPDAGNGKVAAALLSELNTGVPTKNLWHAVDAADLLNRLVKLLEEDRKPDKAFQLSAADRAIALKEVDEIWRALNTPDNAGEITKILQANESAFSSVQKARTVMENSPSVSSVSGMKFTQSDPLRAPRPVGKLPKLLGGLGIFGELLFIGDAITTPFREGSCVFGDQCPVDPASIA